MSEAPIPPTMKKLALGKNWELYGYTDKLEYQLVFKMPGIEQTLGLKSDTVENLIELFKQKLEPYLHRPDVSDSHWVVVCQTLSQIIINYDRKKASLSDGVITVTMEKFPPNAANPNGHWVQATVEIGTDSEHAFVPAQWGVLIADTHTASDCAARIKDLTNLTYDAVMKSYALYRNCAWSTQCILDGLKLYKGASSAM